MINKLFYSSNNKNAIKSVINEDIETSFNIKINNNYDDMINETMEYVLSQVSSTPPKGMKEQEYLFLMNKKVYDIITPVIKTSAKKTNLNLNPIQKININTDKKNNSLSDTIFDPLLLKNYENPPIMDYPKPGIVNNNENIDLKIKSLENERSVLTPKIRPIDFTIKTEKNNNTTQLYNELLTNYNQQVNSLTDFENSQKNINEKIERIEENELSYYDKNNLYTPIDLLQNKNQTKNFFQTDNLKDITKDISKNIAYNRNDIETFINNDFNHEPGDFNETTSQITNQRAEFSSVFPKNESIMLDEPSFKLIEKNFFVIFDSADRDLYEYPNPNSFQVKFSPAGNNLKFESYYDNYNTLILNEKTVVYGDGSKASINETFDNINNISCKCVNVPTNIIYIGSKDPQITHTGIPLNIYKNSYLYLVIPELRGPYRGGNLLAYNSFAKLLIDYGTNANQIGTLSLSNFTTLKTADYNENFIYDPVTAGKIDKMTLNLVNKNGKPYNFGIDKLFIERFSEGKEIYNGYCGEKYTSTIIKIQNKNDEYIKYCSLYYKTGLCDYLNSHPIIGGDLLYFYDTLPTNEQVAFLEDYIKISKIKYIKKNNQIQLYLHYLKIIDNEEKNINVNLKYIIPGVDINNYYIVLFDTKSNKYYYLRVQSMSNEYIVLDYPENLPQFKNYQNIKIGITKNNLRGYNNADLNSLFNNSGYNVIDVGLTSDEQWNIEINFPYQNLPNYLKDPILCKPGSIFLIQEKMQISYTFTITIMTKDYGEIKSQLNASGNN